MVLIFIVIIIGGLGSVGGCFVGALLVGLVANYVGFLAPKVALGSNILLMVLILLWRPQGLYPMQQAMMLESPLRRPAAQPDPCGAAGRDPARRWRWRRSSSPARGRSTWRPRSASSWCWRRATTCCSATPASCPSPTPCSSASAATASPSPCRGWTPAGRDRAGHRRRARAVAGAVVPDRPVLAARARDLLRHDHARGGLVLRHPGLAALGHHRRRGRHYLPKAAPSLPALA